MLAVAFMGTTSVTAHHLSKTQSCGTLYSSTRPW